MSTATAPRLPREVNLCGILYRVAEPDGMIVFSESCGVWGCVTRFSFQKKSMCWYVSIEGTRDNVMACHILKAYEMVCAAYGGNHSEGRL